MTAPHVLDAQGNVLEVGSRVERAFDTGKKGCITGEVDEILKGGTVAVVWNPRFLLRSFFESDRRFSLRRSYRCPDLLITTAKEKGAVNG